MSLSILKYFKSGTSQNTMSPYICWYIQFCFNMEILPSGMTLTTLRYTVIILKNVIFVFMSCWSTVQWSMIMQQKYTLYMECSIPSFHSIEPCTALEKSLILSLPSFIEFFPRDKCLTQMSGTHLQLIDYRLISALSLERIRRQNLIFSQPDSGSRETKSSIFLQNQASGT